MPDSHQNLSYLYLYQQRAVPTHRAATGVGIKDPVGAAREKLRRSASSIFLIINVQNVKNTDTAGLNGYYADKKVLWIKRHIAVGSPGLPHAVAETTADVTDRK